MNGMRGNHSERQIILGLLAQGFSASQSRMLHGRYGPKSLSIMTENPYLLVEDVRRQLILRAIVSSKYILTFICTCFRYKALAWTLLTKLPRKKASVSTASSDWPVAFCTHYRSGQQRTVIVAWIEKHWLIKLRIYCLKVVRRIFQCMVTFPRMRRYLGTGWYRVCG